MQEAEVIGFDDTGGRPGHGMQEKHEPNKVIAWGDRDYTPGEFRSLLLGAGSLRERGRAGEPALPELERVPGRDTGDSTGRIRPGDLSFHGYQGTLRDLVHGTLLLSTIPDFEPFESDVPVSSGWPEHQHLPVRNFIAPGGSLECPLGRCPMMSVLKKKFEKIQEMRR